MNFLRKNYVFLFCVFVMGLISSCKYFLDKEEKVYYKYYPNKKVLSDFDFKIGSFWIYQTDSMKTNHDSVFVSSTDSIRQYEWAKTCDCSGNSCPCISYHYTYTAFIETLKMDTGNSYYIIRGNTLHYSSYYPNNRNGSSNQYYNGEHSITFNNGKYNSEIENGVLINGLGVFDSVLISRDVIRSYNPNHSDSTVIYIKAKIGVLKVLKFRDSKLLEKKEIVRYEIIK